MFAPRHTRFARGLAIARNISAMTFSEILMAVALLTVTWGVTMWGLAECNRYAEVSRDHVAASAIAQTQIDQILTQPFSVGSGIVPPVLALGTQSQTVTLYPTTNGVPREGTMTTTVTDISQTIGNQTASLRRANVVVTFTTRGRQYSVSMDTVRGSDS
jgi:hypothetical protein